SYVQQFATMQPYDHRVKAIFGGAVYSLPVNLATINQIFGATMSPDEARAFVASKAIQIEQPRNFEEQALSTIGAELYHAFFRGYT
ncbi:UDP-galactopyranose mutase, partial [Pseudomonas sp. FW306-2-11AD]